MDSSSKYNPLYDPKTDNFPIADEVQQRLNKPMATSYSSEDEMFLNMIISMVDEKKINLYTPDSLINHSVYDTLDLTGKGKADQNAMIMLTKIREIYNLVKAIPEPNFQVKNLVASLRQNKESVEKLAGNIFVI